MIVKLHRNKQEHRQIKELKSALEKLFSCPLEVEDFLRTLEQAKRISNWTTSPEIQISNKQFNEELREMLQSDGAHVYVHPHGYMINSDKDALTADKKKLRGAKLTLPPGIRLRSIAEFVFTRKTFEQTFEPLINDIQLEYTEALAAHRKWKARYVRISGYVIFWRTAVIFCLSSTIGKLIRDAISMVG